MTDENRLKIYEIPGLIYPEDHLGRPITLDSLERMTEFGPIQIPLEDLTVITGGKGKIAQLNTLGIKTAQRIRPLNEIGWMYIDEDNRFNMPTLSTQYNIILSGKSRGARVETRYCAGTDTTVFGMEVSKHSLLVLDSTTTYERKLRYLERVKEQNIPLFCIHGWSVEDREKPLQSYYFSVLLQYNLTDEMYEAAMEGISKGSSMPMGINLADERWHSNLIDALVGYNLFSLDNSHPIHGLHQVDKQVLPLFTSIPRGIDEIALRLMGVQL